MPRSRAVLIPLLVTLITGAAGALAPSALASGNQEAIFQDDVQLLANPVGTLHTMRDLGVTRVRVGLYWYRIAPHGNSRRRPSGFNASDPNARGYNWGIYDQIVRQARADGIQVYALVTGPAPLWAAGSGQPRGGPYGQWKPSSGEFGAFVRAAGARYSGSSRPSRNSSSLPRISFWSIWNEPNYGIDLAPQATNGDTIEVSAPEYRGLVDAAWSGLSASGHGRDTILFGETAPRGKNHPIGNFSGVKPLRFLRALYCVDGNYRPLRGSAASSRGCPTSSSGSRRFRSAHPALFNASGFAAHPYVQGFAPNLSTYECGSQVCASSSRSDPEYADLAQLPRLGRVLDRLNRVYGSGRQFPIWNTEYGYWTNPPLRAAQINPSTAAFYINWAEYISWRNPRLRSYDQYLLVDPPKNNFASGLVFKNGSHKPGYDAYRLPIMLPSTSTRRGRSLEVWGCARPAHFGGSQQVAIQLQRGSRGGFQTVRTVAITNSRGYFDVRQAFSASGTVRLEWRDDRGKAVHSRSVKISVR
ncbi:MAG: hypothetical protein JO179_22700 [Solirubrobacterales bacterium]|nr:hypothetical protein [Solirubrobacterales bacterium]